MRDFVVDSSLSDVDGLAVVHRSKLCPKVQRLYGMLSAFSI